VRNGDGGTPQTIIKVEVQESQPHPDSSINHRPVCSVRPSALPVGSSDDFFHWNDALAILSQGAVNPRPSRFTERMAASVQTFLEAPVLKRRKGDDKWATSGGCKGATEHWFTADTGLLKRYGRIVCIEGGQLKFAQYSMLRARVVRDGERKVFNDKHAVLWVVRPAACVLGDKHSSSATLECTNEAASQATVDIFAERKFISFQSRETSDAGPSIELGEIVRHGDGIKLMSGQGDFAEYHRRADGEPPFEEGDVVGFRRGVLSRKTTNCSMLGIISRKAVVEGSAPPKSERCLYDTVAYNGIVPVKLSLSTSSAPSSGCACTAVPEQGQLLVPSGNHDGTAVLVPADSGLRSRVGIMLDDCSDVISKQAGDSPSSSYRLVNAVVVTPSETVRTNKASTAAMRNLALALICCMVTTAVGMSLFDNLDPLLKPDLQGEISCAPFSSTHNISQLVGYAARNPGASTIGDLGLKCAVGFSGTAHIECPGRREQFGKVSGCVANNCSVDLYYPIVGGIDGRSPVIQTPGAFSGYVLGRDMELVSVNRTADTTVENDYFRRPVDKTVGWRMEWRTEPPYVAAAELSMTCNLGFTTAERPTAVCLEERGAFSQFRGCRTTDVCAALDKSKIRGATWQQHQDCLSRQDQFSLNTTRNRDRCLMGGECQFCTQTALGTYCTY
jgi:hypothetical protein